MRLNIQSEFSKAMQNEWERKANVWNICSECKNTAANQWCIFASTLHDRRQITGPQAPLAGTKALKMRSRYILMNLEIRD
jgi:hypothetical protein